MLKRMLVILVVALAVAGCAGPAAQPTSPPNPTAQPAAAPADWPRAWLRGEPCAPPCFLGITPGISTRDEALELMRSAFPEVVPEELPSFAGDDTMIHVFMKDQQGQLQTASAYYYTAPARTSATPANTIVAFITAAPNMASFSEIIATFGEPSHILAKSSYSEHSGTYHELAAVYLDRGLLVSFTAGKGKDNPDVTPELLAQWAVGFAPSPAGFNEGMAAYYDLAEASTLLVPWQGFQPFAAYCRETQPNDNMQGCP